MGKLLVTGAMGHVGFETVKQAANQGIEVVAQYKSTFRSADAESLGPNVSWVKCDISDPFQLALMASDPSIDTCIHTAAVPSDAVGLPDPGRTFQSNVVATQMLLEVARKNTWRRFIQVSTGSVFQALPDVVTPVPETLAPSPRTLYGCTKRSAELVTAAYANSYGVAAVTVRISWIFGPPLVPKKTDGPRGPIPDFLRRALNGEAIDDPSGGDFAASFTYVPDCAAGLLVLANAKALAHPVYHLGSGRNFTTFEVADAVRAAVPGADIQVGPGTKPWTHDTVMRGPLECTRMQDELGFVPLHDLNQAVRAFADWMRDNPESFSTSD